MSSTTALQGLPYPVGSTDAPDGPAQIQALAIAVEKKLAMIFATASARTAAFTAASLSPTEGMRSWLQDKNRFEFFSAGSLWVPEPYGSIYRARQQTTGQAIANNTVTALTTNVEDQDDDAAGTSGTYTAPWTGWYELTGLVAHGNSNVNRRGAQWLVNGAAAPGGGQALGPATGTGSSGMLQPAPHELIKLTAADTVQLAAFQDSGGSLTTGVTAGSQTTVQVVWLRP